MQVFDVWPFQIGPFLQSGLVPIVLAPIWVLYVYLQPLMDNFWPGVSSCTDHHLCFLLSWTFTSTQRCCSRVAACRLANCTMLH